MGGVSPEGVVGPAACLVLSEQRGCQKVGSVLKVEMTILHCPSNNVSTVTVGGSTGMSIIMASFTREWQHGIHDCQSINLEHYLPTDIEQVQIEAKFYTLR